MANKETYSRTQLVALYEELRRREDIAAAAVVRGLGGHDAYHRGKVKGLQVASRLLSDLLRLEDNEDDDTTAPDPKYDYRG